VAVAPVDLYLASMANYLLKLFGPRRARLDEIEVPAGDDLSAIRRLKETYPARLEECDCAELYGPDGKLVWETHDEP
jgi:hypothetical protein